MLHKRQIRKLLRTEKPGEDVFPPYGLGSGSKVRVTNQDGVKTSGGRLRMGTKDVKRCLPEDNFAKTKEKK